MRIFRTVTIKAAAGDNWLDLDGQPTNGFLLSTVVLGEHSTLTPLNRSNLECGSVSKKLDEGESVAQLHAFSFSITNIEQLYKKLQLANDGALNFIGRRVEYKLFVDGQSSTLFAGVIDRLWGDRDRIYFECLSIESRLDLPVGRLAGTVNNKGANNIVPIVFGDMTDEEAFVPVLDGLDRTNSSIMFESKKVKGDPKLLVWSDDTKEAYSVYSATNSNGLGVIQLAAGSPASLAVDVDDTIGDIPLHANELGEIYRNLETNELVMSCLDENTHSFRFRGDDDMSSGLPPAYFPAIFSRGRTLRGWQGSQKQPAKAGDTFLPISDELRTYQLGIEVTAKVKKIYDEKNTVWPSTILTDAGITYSQSGFFGDANNSFSRTTETLEPYEDANLPQNPPDGTAFKLDEFFYYTVPLIKVSDLSISGNWESLPSIKINGAETWKQRDEAGRWIVGLPSIGVCLRVEFDWPSFEGDLDYLAIVNNLTTIGGFYQAGHEKIRNPSVPLQIEVGGVGDVVSTQYNKDNVSNYAADGFTQLKDLVANYQEVSGLRVALSTGFGGTTLGGIYQDVTPDSMEMAKRSLFAIDTIPGGYHINEVVTQTRVRKFYGLARVQTKVKADKLFVRTYGREAGGHLVEHPVSVINNLLGVELATISPPTIDATNGRRDAWEFAGQISGERKRFRSLLKQICEEFCLIAYSSGDVFPHKITTEECSSPTIAFHDDELLLEANRSAWRLQEVGETYSRFEITYRHNAAEKVMTKILWVDSEGASEELFNLFDSRTVYSLMECCKKEGGVYQKDLHFIRSPQTAAQHLKTVCYTNSRQKEQLELTVPIDRLLGVEFGDICSVEIEGVADGSKAYRVVGIDAQGTRATITAREVLYVVL